MDKSKLLIARGEEIHNAVVYKDRSEQIPEDFLKQIDEFHSLDEIFDKEIEELLLLEELNNLRNPKQLNFEPNIVTFSPSSASSCERELYYKAINAEKDELPLLPYQRRWVRNGSAVHKAVQKELLLAEKYLPNPAFTVERMENGTIAWEHNLKNVKQFEYDGVRFQIFGMADGILRYKDGSKIVFEFKTKSTTISAVGNYKMRDVQENHKQQAVAYSLLFGIDEFLFVYESLAKDNWTKGEDARPDVRAFYFKVTDEMKENLLAKFARVVKCVERGEIPAPETDKCIFCPYKSLCEKDGRQ